MDLGSMLSAAAARSVEVEALLHGGRQQPLPHDLLGRVLRQLQVVDARVHRRVAGVGGVHLKGAAWSQSAVSLNELSGQSEHTYLSDDGEARVQVRQAAGGQRGAAGGELQERFPLVRRHSA